MLAYSTDTVLGNPQEVTDQTIWQLTNSDYGRITGKSIAVLANTDGQKTPPTDQDMTGFVGPDGQVLWTHRGFTLDQRPELDRQIDRIVKK